MIVCASVLPFGFPLRRPTGNASRSWTEREGLLFRVEGAGLVGWGEASPLPGFSPDALADVARDLARASARLDAVNETVLYDAMLEDAVRRVGPLGPSAAFAVETALLDLRARMEGVPLWRLLAPRGHVSPVAISALASGVTTDELVAAAMAATARGLTCVKLKVGRPGMLEREVSAARAVRAAIGSSCALRLDANGAWSPSEAAVAMDRFAPERPELLEEPVSGGAWRELVVRSGDPPVPLALDESIAGVGGAELAEELLATRAIDAVVIKLAIVGGFRSALALARRAEAAGAGVVVTHMFEGPVATAAAGALAIALRPRHSAGLDVRSYATFELDDGHPVGATHARPTDALGLGAAPSDLVSRSL